MNKLVTSRLKRYILSCVQSNLSFRQNRSIMMIMNQIIRLQDQLDTLILNNRRLTLRILLDFEKAIYLILHQSLISKLENMGLSRSILSWNQYVIFFQVQVGNKFYYIHYTQNGTTQSSTISPILYIYVIINLPESLSN